MKTIIKIFLGLVVFMILSECAMIKKNIQWSFTKCRGKVYICVF